MPKISNARHALAIALQRAGFRRDSRASEAYSLPGQEGMVRVDFGGGRSKSASIQAKHSPGASYSNIGQTIYFGYMRTEAEVDGWARYLHAVATGEKMVPHPPIPVRKPPRPETVARREQRKERTEGRGFYVVNETTGGVMTSGRLAANHGPFQTLDEAVPVAWRQLQEYLDMKFTYLLPVKIVEARSKKDAERGYGHVWWIDGRMRGAPVPAEQERFPFANQAKGRMSPEDRLFVGVFPTGISYADRAREVAGDYRRLAFLPFGTLVLEWEKGVPAELRKIIEVGARAIRARRGEQFQVSSSGQAVTLGYALAGGSSTGNRAKRDPWDPRPEVRKRMTPEQKKALADYRFAVQQEDRYLGSVFVTPSGQRRVEETTREAYERCQRLGLGAEHGL